MRLLSTPLPDTRPYPWPYDGAVDLSSCALVLCGWQAAFADLGPADAAVTAARLADEWSAAGGLTIAVTHAAVTRRPSWLPAPGVAGATPLPIPPDALVVAAFGWDGCHGSTLEPQLRA